MCNIESRFFGTWSLREWNSRAQGEEASRPAYGGKATGHIIYTADGWVSATLMEVGRRPVSDDRLAIQKLKKAMIKDPLLTPEPDQLDILKQYTQAAGGYIAYCGTFHVDDKEVHHRVEEALLPQMIDTTLTRRYRFSDDTLTLTATMGEYQEELVWERVLLRSYRL